MSSTEFTQGLEGGRNSSKVLKPPGGDSSDIFGANEAAGKKPVHPGTSTKSRLFGQGEASPTRTYVRRNPITGEGVQEEKLKAQGEEEKILQDNADKACEQPVTEAPKVVQTSIRVRNPPGGKSSGIF